MYAKFTPFPSSSTTLFSRICVGLIFSFNLTLATPVFAVPAPQSITFTTPSDIALTDPAFTAIATGGGSGNPVTFISNTPAVCTATGANGATITPVGLGFCSIAANQAGLGVTFLAAPTVTQAFFIKLGQTITFGALSTKIADDPPFEVTATSSATGINATSPITFTSLTLSVCTTGGVNGSTVTLINAGVCTIQANQASNTTYAAAAPVNQSFTATPVTKVTASIIGAANGSITPFGRILVLLEDKTEFRISPNPGYLAQVGGTCGGAFVNMGGIPPGGNNSVYVIAPFTENCSVTFTFVAQRPTLTISGVLGVTTPVLAMPTPTSSVENTPVTFAATLRGAVGTVDSAVLSFFSDGASISGCENRPVVFAPIDDASAYRATCTTSALARGTRIITAQFAGNANNFAATTDASAIPSQALTHTVTTAPPIPDTTPDNFSFIPQSGLTLSVAATSNVITVTGINTSTTISINGVGSAYSIGCNGVFTSTTSSINNGESVCVRQTTSGLNNTTVTATLTIGGVSATFSATTLSFIPDTTPDAFGFTTISGAMAGATLISNAITVSGINSPAPISIDAPASTTAAFSVGCDSTFTTAPTTITNGARVCVRLTANANDGASAKANLVIGGVTGIFTVENATIAPVKRFRIYISSTLGHLFTTDENEYNVLTIRSPTIYLAEGVDHRVYRSALMRDNQVTVPYYRLYLRGIRQHFWTTDANEYNALRADTTNVGDDGIDSYIFLRAGVAGTVPLYRMVLTGTAIHHWTVDANEFNVLTSSGVWLGEGAAGNPPGVTGYVWPR